MRQTGDGIEPEHHDIRGTRLGEGLTAGELRASAIDRTLAAVAEFWLLAKQTDAARIIGTAALREACNASDFARRVRETTGADLRILSGEEEARASFDGALWSLRQAGASGLRAVDALGTLTVVDVGGGSTEFATRASRGAGVVSISLQIGAVQLTERFFQHDPPRANEVAACATAIRLALANAGKVAGPLVFVGGTADTAARMLNAYDPAGSVHVATLRLDDLVDLRRLTSSLTLAERKRLHALPESRADIFPAGLLIIEEITKVAGANELTITETDMLLGFALEQFWSSGNSDRE